MRVLVVDDETPILTATTTLLKELGYEAVGTSDAASVQAWIRDYRPAALLQDVRMPGLDIHQHVAALRADPTTQDVRIVLFSAGMEVGQIAEELNVPMIEKPFRIEDLVQALGAPVSAAAG